MAYNLTVADKKLIEFIAKETNLHIQVLDEDSTHADTVIDINGSHNVELANGDHRFTVCIVTPRPGVRYHSDGSGTPDDVDVEQIGEYPSFTEAFASAASLAVHQMVFEAAEGIAEAMEFEKFPEHF